MPNPTIEPKGWTCDNCGNVNDPDEDHCDSCGADMDGWIEEDEEEAEDE